MKGSSVREGSRESPRFSDRFSDTFSKEVYMLFLILLGVLLLVLVLGISIFGAWLLDNTNAVKRQMDDPKYWQQELEASRKKVAEAEGHLRRLSPESTNS